MYQTPPASCPKTTSTRSRRAPWLLPRCRALVARRGCGRASRSRDRLSFYVPSDKLSLVRKGTLCRRFGGREAGSGWHEGFFFRHRVPVGAGRRFSGRGRRGQGGAGGGGVRPVGGGGQEDGGLKPAQARADR